MKLNTLGKFFRIWYPSITMAIIIFILSSFQATDSDKQSGLIINAITTIFPEAKSATNLVTIIRKTAHFTEYAILGFLTARSFKLSKESPWLSILACATYASTDEFHQMFVPGRSGEVRDILVDTAGAAFGTSIYWLITRKKH